MQKPFVKNSVSDTATLTPYKVCCYNCKYWGFNCGKILNSQGVSRCTKRKKDWTWASQYCRGFVPKEKE